MGAADGLRLGRDLAEHDICTLAVNLSPAQFKTSDISALVNTAC